MTRNTAQSVATIDQFISQVGSVKTAADGSKPLSEPGSIGGETTHPVKKVDDRLQKATEGERSKENERDVKEDVGQPSIENAPEASTKNAAARNIFNVAAGFAKKAEGAVSQPGSAAEDHLGVNTKVSATGEDPAHETNSAKAGKDDKRQGNMGGTKHPANTENDSLDGHKYAGDDGLDKMASDMATLGDRLLAGLHGVYQTAGQAAPASVKTASAQQPQGGEQIDPRLAYMAGNELAGLMNGTFDKKAADSLVRGTLHGIVKQASEDADMFITYAQNFFKQAEGEPPPDEEEGGGGGGEGPPAPGGGDEAGMMAALGGGAGGAEPPPGAGGGGMDMMGGAGGGDHEATMLAQILQKLNVTPEELEQAMAEMGGGGGDMGGAGGPPPGPGGPPPAPGGDAGAPPGMETQANAGGGKRNAKPQQTKYAAEEIQNHIKEIVGRSRMARR